MSVRIRESADICVILFAFRGDNDVFYFVDTRNKTLPGLSFRPKPLEPINLQIISSVCDFFHDLDLTTRMHVVQDFREEFFYQSKSVALYIVLSDVSCDEKNYQYLTLPAMMKLMPKNKTRLAYMKALQWIAGAHKETIKAISTEDLTKS